MTLQERLTEYKRVYNFIYGDIYCYGLCLLLHTDSECMPIDYPEIWKQRTLRYRLRFSPYWWKYGKVKPRLRALEKAIKEVENKIKKEKI
jgi:hypothetical protein